jgi:hypothetical protein
MDALRLYSEAIQVMDYQTYAEGPDKGPFLTIKIDLSKSKTQIRHDFLKILDQQWPRGGENRL